MSARHHFVRLVSEIIAESVSDYKMLSELGVIQGGGKINPEWLNDRNRLKRKVFTYHSKLDVLELIQFFTEDKCDRWLELAQLDISAAQIRCKLGINQ
jgi:hypothetical protein